MIDVGVAKPERARAGDDQDRHRVEQREVEGRLGPGEQPDHERQRRQADHDGDEHAGHGIGEPLDRRPRALRLGHEADDLGEDRVPADPGRAHGQRPGRVDGRADDLVAGRLANGDALAGDHALVDRRATVDDDAVDRDLLARPHPDDVADRDGRDRDVELLAVTQDARCSRREADETAHGVRRRGSRPRLEIAPGQDQGDDRRGGVEVERQLLAARAQAGGPEEVREQDRGDRVQVGGGRADHDQRVHVRRRRDEGPATRRRRTAAPAQSWTGVASASWTSGSDRNAGSHGATVIRASPSRSGIVRAVDDDQAAAQRREVSGSSDVSLRALRGDVLDRRRARRRPRRGRCVPRSRPPRRLRRAVRCRRVRGRSGRSPSRSRG